MASETDQAQHGGQPHGLLRLLRFLLALPVLIYQKLISPLLPPHCIYTPSCSAYTRQAIARHGVLGAFAGILRLFRCIGGVFTGGEDPVPDRLTAAYLFGSFRRFRNREKS